MSAALNIQPDTTTQSNGTHPDLSLGSLASEFASPQKLNRVPSATSQTTATSSAPLTTPSPPGPSFVRRKADIDATPLVKRSGLSTYEEAADDSDGRWDAPNTPIATRPTRTRSGSKGGVNLTLRDQEKHIDNLKKENFSIKLKVHFLEERLAQLAPDQIDAALKQNIHLKIEVQQRGVELKKYKKLVLELQRELDRANASGGRGRERELEAQLEEREREIRELRRRRAVGPEDGALNEAEARNTELQDRMVNLEDELEGARLLLEENVEEIERLREMLEKRGEESMTTDGGESRRDRLKRKLGELEGENEELKARIQEQEEVLAVREEEREELADEIERLRLQLEELERKREAESIERSESRAQILEEREEREAVEEDYNAIRDKLAAATIELQQREDELESKEKEIDNIMIDHERIVRSVEEDWKGEVDEVRAQVEELRDVIAERDTESKELRLQISELEAQSNNLHAKYEEAFANMEQQLDERDEEIENANREIERLGEQVYTLEEEAYRTKEESDRLREDEAVERERLEGLSAVLKEKIANLKTQLQETTELYETCSRDIIAHRERQEELARHVEDLVEEVQRKREAREQAEADLETSENNHDAELRRERRALEAKESALQSALADLTRTQALLTQREADLAAVQSALRALEAESRKAGETHTTDRFSLELEVDRLKRDLDRLEDELSRARKELDDKEVRARERENVVDRLHAENRDLASQLAAQTQARLNVTDKLDGVQASLRTAEAEVATFRARVNDLEQRMSKDQRSLAQVENQYRDQLTERNTLLLTIYQYMDKILGVDKTPKKAETKPFTNFGVFHDNIITRMKALSQIQLDFDKRCKDVEGRFMERMNDMKKQLDNRWKQIDKFEASVKTFAETKASWRRKLSTREGELEAIKATNADMQTQLSILKRAAPTDSVEIRSLQARAANAERRLTNAQNQLLASEEKLASVNQKTTAADGKWEARVKEYEARLKAAEEKVKRERQGTKERVAELEANVKSLQRQLELATKRIQQLNEVTEVTKGVSGSPGR